MVTSRPTTRSDGLNQSSVSGFLVFFFFWKTPPSTPLLRTLGS